MREAATAGGRPGPPLAVFAGSGALPALVSRAAAAHRRAPIVFAISGEADPGSFGAFPVHVVRWGDIGRMFRLAEEAECHQAVFIGGITRRPELRQIMPDLGGLKLVPRIIQLLRAGDDGLLRGISEIFEERGIKVVSPLDIAPDLVVPPGFLAGKAGAGTLQEVAKGAEAARLIGRLDIGQAAITVAGRVVAVEDAGGTDALLERVNLLRRQRKIPESGGILVKCMKPQQDPRLDLPTIGPATAEKAKAAGLAGVAAETGRALLVGRAETEEAFRRAGLFLLGITPETAPGHG